MLEPDYFNDKSDTLIKMYHDLEDAIFQDIADRLLKSGDKIGGTTERELYKLEQIGLHKEYILKRLKDFTGLTEKQLKKILQGAVMTSWESDADVYAEAGIYVPNPFDMPAIMEIMDAEYKKTCGELNNLTMSTMAQSSKDLLDMLNEAEFRVATGFQSYSSAICEVLDNYAHKGIMVDYPTGARRTLESAVRCCVVTSLNQTAAQVSNKYIRVYNAPYVVISAHLGARHDDKKPNSLESHDWWQGRVFKIDGADEYPNLLESTGYSIDEDGTGHVVNPLGLHGYNCRHSHQPFFKGMRNPWLDENGNIKVSKRESQKKYRISQTQRQQERRMRQLQREMLAKRKEIYYADEQDINKLQNQYDRKAYMLSEKQREYDNFCEVHKLTKQNDRIRAAGYNIASANEARVRAELYSDKLGVSERAVKIRDKVLDNIKNDGRIDISRISDYETIAAGMKRGKQAIHLQGDKYIEGRSYLYGSEDDVQRLYNKYAGKGKLWVNNKGIWINKEAIRAKEPIGTCISITEDGKQEECETREAFIIYSKEGFHIVPKKESEDV